MSSFALFSSPPELCCSVEGCFSSNIQKLDVWNFGLSSLELLNGLNCIKKFSEFRLQDYIETIPTYFIPMFEAIFNPNPNERISFSELIKTYLSNDDMIEQLGNSRTLSLVTKSVSINSSEMPQPNYPSHSRYYNDFEELEFLGKGGFGEVVKVRNRLDNRFYAIKKIKLKPFNQNLNKKLLREVLAISRLHHENIVRYYQAWLEGDESAGDASDTPDSYSEALDTSQISSHHSFESDGNYVVFRDENALTTSYDWLVFDNDKESIVEYCKTFFIFE